VNDGKVAAHHNAGAAQLAKNLGKDAMIAGQLVIQPDVFHRQPQFLQQMKNKFQFPIDQRFTGHPAIESGYSDERFPVEHGDGNFHAEEFEFLLHFAIVTHFIAVPPKNAAMLKQVTADASLERELKMFQQARG
jgi:hypothetical protein